MHANVMVFEEYYKNLGLSEYPFGIYTSEAETEKFSKIYVKPANHSVIIEGLKNTSAIVVGERGTGKTALSLDGSRVLSTSENLVIRIEEFSSLKENYTTEDLYRFLIERVAAEFFLNISKSPNNLWQYSKDDRIDLSMYLHSYLSVSSKNQLKDRINKIQNGIVKRGLIRSYNFLRVTLNYGLAAATKVASDALTRHFSSLPSFDSGDTEYFKRIELEIDQSFAAEQKQYLNLEKLCHLIKKTNYKKYIS